MGQCADATRGTMVFCCVSVSCWSSSFSMFSVRNSLKAELQQVSSRKQKTLPAERGGIIFRLLSRDFERRIKC